MRKKIKIGFLILCLMLFGIPSKINYAEDTSNSSGNQEVLTEEIPDDDFIEEIEPEEIEVEEIFPEEILPEVIVPQEIVPEEIEPDDDYYEEDDSIEEEIEEILIEEIVPEITPPQEIAPEEIEPDDDFLDDDDFLGDEIEVEEIFSEEILPEVIVPEGIVPNPAKTSPSLEPISLSPLPPPPTSPTPPVAPPLPMKETEKEETKPSLDDFKEKLEEAFVKTSVTAYASGGPCQGDSDCLIDQMMGVEEKGGAKIHTGKGFWMFVATNDGSSQKKPAHQGKYMKNHSKNDKEKRNTEVASYAEVLSKTDTRNTEKKEDKENEERGDKGKGNDEEERGNRDEATELVVDQVLDKLFSLPVNPDPLILPATSGETPLLKGMETPPALRGPQPLPNLTNVSAMRPLVMPDDHLTKAIKKVMRDEPLVNLTPQLTKVKSPELFVTPSKDALDYYEQLQKQGIMPQYTVTVVVVFEGGVSTQAVGSDGKTLSESSPTTVFVKPGQMAQVVPIGKDTVSLNKGYAYLAPPDYTSSKISPPVILGPPGLGQLVSRAITFIEDAKSHVRHSGEEIPLTSPHTHGALVLKVQGMDATAVFPGSSLAQPITTGMPLPEKSSVHTGKGSRVEAAIFSHGQYIGRIKIDEMTHVLIAAIAEEDADQDTTKLVNALGKTTVEFEKSKNKSKFVVETPTASAAVRGTVFDVIVRAQD
ncbi:MAG: FecR domain-containing protein [Candidatus Omnitrophica bacterium]|nr:FecR domain-containing protein [Candidatus Omnitrophota bacterium]